MGGNVALTIRTETNDYRMDRWTNIMPWLLHMPALLEGKPEGLDAALESWLSMKADWETHGPKGPFDQPMTSAYAPYPYGLKPSEYGAIVMDFPSKTLLSLQGYCDVGSVGWMRMEGGPIARQMNPERDDDVRALITAGRVTSYEAVVKDPHAISGLLALEGAHLLPSPYNQELKILRIPGTLDAQTVLDAADAILDAAPGFSRPFMMARVNVDMSPFQVEQFDESPKGYKAMLARIDALGIPLSEAERKAWLKRASRT